MYLFFRAYTANTDITTEIPIKTPIEIFKYFIWVNLVVAQLKPTFKLLSFEVYKAMTDTANVIFTQICDTFNSVSTVIVINGIAAVVAIGNEIITSMDSYN